METTIQLMHMVIARWNGIDLSDDRGVEESPGKIIWIAAGVVIAVAATLFAINLYNDAESQVPDVVVPN